MRLYSVDISISARQQIVVAAEDEDFAMDKAQDRINIREAEIVDIDMEIEDVTEIYGGAGVNKLRNGFTGSPLREVVADGTAIVTREMITAAHGVTLESGDVVLSARLLERIYLAMNALPWNRNETASLDRHAEITALKRRRTCTRANIWQYTRTNVGRRIHWVSTTTGAVTVKVGRPMSRFNLTPLLAISSEWYLSPRTLDVQAILNAMAWL